jgi:hypothetical protein
MVMVFFILIQVLTYLALVNNIKDSLMMVTKREKDHTIIKMGLTILENGIMI